MISDEFLDQVIAMISRAGLSQASVAALRDAFPDQHFTYCLEDDIGAGVEPFRESNGFNLYLVDGHNHCLTLTRDTEAATGLVLAEVTEDA
ncbi:MAG: DUF6129 family protein [Thiohalocapsa sp.]